MGVGGVSAAIGGVGGAVTKLATPKEIINGTLKTAGKEALGGFVEDVCFQMFVEGKSVTEIDWGQSLTTSSISGLAGATSFLASQGRMHLDPPSKIKVSEAAALIDNVADVPSHPKANILPEASTKPNRGAVKNAAGGLADAGSAGNAGRKSLTKNQNKIQSQIVDSTLSGNTIKTKSKSKEIPPLPYTEKWKQYFNETYGGNNVEWQNHGYGMGARRSNNKSISDDMKQFIPMDADGNPIPLKEHKHKNTSIPLPDPAFEGQPHIVFGGRISSDTGELYLQTAIFDGKDDWLKVNGHPVPRTVIDWTNHYMPWAHDNPHQHVFYYDFKEKKWLRGDAEYFEPSVFFRLIKAGYTSR